MLRATMASLQADTGESARSRIAWRLLPFLFLLYVANYLDRTNIAYATLGMKGDLGLTDSVFGTASGIFFIGYFALQIPGPVLSRLRCSFTARVSCSARPRLGSFPESLFIFLIGSFIRTEPRRWRGLCPPFRLDLSSVGRLLAQSWVSTGLAFPVGGGFSCLKAFPRCCSERRPWSCCPTGLTKYNGCSLTNAIG